MYYLITYFFYVLVVLLEDQGLPEEVLLKLKKKKIMLHVDPLENSNVKVCLWLNLCIHFAVFHFIIDDSMSFLTITSCDSCFTYRSIR